MKNWLCELHSSVAKENIIVAILKHIFTPDISNLNSQTAIDMWQCIEA